MLTLVVFTICVVMCAFIFAFNTVFIKMRKHDRDISSLYNIVSMLNDTVKEMSHALSDPNVHGAAYYERTKREVTNIMRVTTDTVASHAIDINNLKGSLSQLIDRVDSLEDDTREQKKPIDSPIPLM